MSTIKIVSSNKSDKQALQEWEDFLLSIRNSTPIDVNETPTKKAERIKRLEGDFEEWIKYYFPKYCFAPPADFHKKSSRKIFKAVKRFYQARQWARGLSKTTRRMMEVLYLKFVKKIRLNSLLLSKTVENAERLLGSYKANLEANQRLINDYGVQEKAGSWTSTEFTTRDGSTFRAVGAEQNPRGAKNEELRINLIIFDDIDDDEVCRNPDRLQARWEWIEQAVIPTVDISAVYYIFFDNNVIAEDSLAVRAAEKADDIETINIRDENGVSTWLEKNSEADIDYMLSIISYESGQKEYYNNPITKGKVFTEMTYGKCPPLNKLSWVIVYGDPATSNKDKPAAKSKHNNSCKGIVIVGYKDLVWYVYKCYLDSIKNSTFIEWLYTARDYIGGKTQAFYYIENNTLQDPFFQQVLKPLNVEMGKTRGGAVPIMGDDRVKPDKYFRIEGELEPLNRNGHLVLNIAEKDDPHMKRLEAQFKSVKPTSKTMDGPDAVEGGVYKGKEKIREVQGNWHFGNRPQNNKRM